MRLGLQGGKVAWIIDSRPEAQLVGRERLTSTSPSWTSFLSFCQNLAMTARRAEGGSWLGVGLEGSEWRRVEAPFFSD